MSENPPERSIGKSLVAGVLALLSTIYIMNPGAGFIEFIPDNIPIFGNLDEAAAAAVLLACLSYFGLDLKRLVGGKGGERPGGEKTVPGKVVERE